MYCYCSELNVLGNTGDVKPSRFFAGYIYSFASSASKKLSESVVETAQTLKKSVEEGKINGIIDKVFHILLCTISVVVKTT